MLRCQPIRVGLADVDEALDLIKSYPGRKHFAGVRQPALIEEAVAALGVPFPPSYRRFLENLGAGSIRGREIYGVIDSNFRDSTIPDGIWLTLRERRDSRLPEALVIVYSTGDGEYVAIDTSKRTSESENPMVLWRPGATSASDALEQVSSDFGSFFLQIVREATGDR